VLPRDELFQVLYRCRYGCHETDGPTFVSWREEAAAESCASASRI